MNICQRIKRRRAELNMTLEEVAKVVGVTRATIQKYENGIINNIPSDKIELLALALTTTPGYLMGWEESALLPSNIEPMPVLVKKPRLGSIACGEPILAEQNIEDYDAVPDYVKCDFTLVCRGDSMIGARIFDGDIVCIKKQETVQNGQIAAILVEGEYESEATLKRVRYLENGVALWPENTAYEPMIYVGEDADRVRIIGLATHFISTMR